MLWLFGHPCYLRGAFGGSGRFRLLLGTWWHMHLYKANGDRDWTWWLPGWLTDDDDNNGGSICVEYQIDIPPICYPLLSFSFSLGISSGAGTLSTQGTSCSTPLWRCCLLTWVSPLFARFSPSTLLPLHNLYHILSCNMRLTTISLIHPVPGLSVHRPLL